MNNIAKFAARCYFPHRDAWQKRVSILGGRARGDAIFYAGAVGVSVSAFMGLFRIEMRA
ncbi:hypothetical protein ACRPOS_006875 [Bartonella heixiaziensis]|uniref:hypothetical protein n=1 Tax=Bartonella heixiaziensis TaxID=1461000 RepID=UPI0039088C61